jgi:hypothetical protein
MIYDITPERILIAEQEADVEYHARFGDADEPYDPDAEPIDEETVARCQAGAEEYRARKVAFCLAVEQALATSHDDAGDAANYTDWLAEHHAASNGTL